MQAASMQFNLCFAAMVWMSAVAKRVDSPSRAYWSGEVSSAFTHDAMCPAPCANSTVAEARQ
eukprot:6072562-Pyramimonas_sp.AAC.1